jgi:hypothetical protein
MKPELPPRVASPCPKSWGAMNGDSKRRYCDHCEHHVHNLSEMTASERRDVLATKGRVCITYTANARGELISHADSNGLLALLSRMRLAFVAIVAAIVPFGLSSCAMRTLGKPAPPPPNPEEVQTELNSDGSCTTLGIMAERSASNNPPPKAQ